MNKQDNGTGKVIPIRNDAAEVSKIEPPTDHAARLKARGNGLYMNAGPGEDEKLVCLYDIVAWLVADCDMPLKPAIETVASVIDGRDCDTFSLSCDNYATPHNPDSPWLKLIDKAESLAAASVRCLGWPVYELSKWANGDGQLPEFLFNEAKETPFEYFGRTDFCRHALTWRKAYELFDWGRVVYAAKGQAAPAMPLPAGWRDELELGHGRSKARYLLKADANTPLVRIVDVLADFATRYGLPAGEAVGDFLAAVNVPLLSEVYWLRENRFAELVGAAHMYGHLTEAQAQKKTREAADDVDERVSRLYGVTTSVFVWAATPLDALKRHIQDHGPERSDRSLYAVSHATANRLWGWGAAQAETQAAPAKEVPKLSGWVEAVAIKKANKDAPLTPVQKIALAAEFNRRKANGATGIAKAMAAELGGISETAFNKLKKAKPGKRETKNNGITTVVSGRKVS